MVQRHGRVCPNDIIHASLLSGDSRHGLDISHVLSHSSALDGTMERPRNHAAPCKNRSTEESKNSTDANEDGSLWQIGLLHERRSSGVWNFHGGNTYTGKCRETGETDAAALGDGGECVVLGWSSRGCSTRLGVIVRV